MNGLDKTRPLVSERSLLIGCVGCRDRVRPKIGEVDRTRDVDCGGLVLPQGDGTGGGGKGMVTT